MAATIIASSIFFCLTVIVASKMFPSNARTFYCAGRAVVEHRNPYLVEPLRSCEHAINPIPGFAPNEVEPAPLPPYAFAGLALWSRLPYFAAHLVWCTLLIGSVVFTALAIARLTAFSVAPVLLAFVFVDGLLNLAFGDIAPLCVAFLCASANYVVRKQYWPTVLCASLATIEPHVALPACLALFIFIPATRPRFLICAIVLCVAAIATLGSSESLDYFRSVLPAHAISEVSAADQYSLTWLLHRLGVNAEWSLRLGSASYACMSAIGIVVGRKLAMHYRQDAFLVLLPPAAVLLGGTFIHDLQLAAALPAALLLAANARRIRGALWCAALLFAYPLSAGGGHLSGILFGCAAGCGIALLAARRSPILNRIVICAAVAGSIVAFDLFASAARTREPQTALRLAAGAGNELASVQWARYIDASAGPGSWSFTDTVKVPVWFALAGLLIVCSAQLRPSTNGAAEPPHY